MTDTKASFGPRQVKNMKEDFTKEWNFHNLC